MKSDYKYILLALLGTIFTCLSYLIYVYNPLQLIIPKVLAFYPNSTVFSLWQRPSYEILTKVYLYHVCNPEQFLAGEEKLRFKEVGPYVYKEQLYNMNVTFNDNGTVSFVPKRFLQFVPEYSVGDPMVDKIVTPNIPLLGITASLVDESMFVNVGMASISTYIDAKSFLNLTIHEYLYGYDDTLVTLANNFVPNWIDFPRFGILDRVMVLDNGSNIVTMNGNLDVKMSDNMRLTEKERLQAYSIQRWNGSPGLKQWGYKEPKNNETTVENSTCNLVEGAFVGTLFPLNLEKNSSFRLYRPAFCRTMPIEYESSGVTKDGFDAYTYRVKRDFLATPDENPDNTCLCKDKCLPSGLSDLSACYYDIPIAMSQPHFLNADPWLLEQVDGLSPDKEKHDLTLTIHPQLGLPLEAKVRIQINIVMPETRYNARTRPFNNMVLPMFWIDVAVDDVPSDVKLYINLLCHVLPVTQQVVMYVLALVGVVLVLGSALASVLLPYKCFRNGRNLGVVYSEIPVFALKTQLLKPTVLVNK